MLDFELNQKIEVKKLYNLTLGEHSIPELSNRLNVVLNKLASKNDNLTFKEFFGHFCPKLNFANIDNLCNEFLNKVKSELVVMQILNSDKEEDYFQNVINGIFLKYIFSKSMKINEKIKMRVDSMLDNLNTLTETKKFTNPMKKQFYYLLKDNKKTHHSHRKYETMNSNQTLDQEVISPFTYQNSFPNKQTEMSDSNRTYYLEGNSNSPMYQDCKKSPENLMIPNFYNTFHKSKYESINLSNRNPNSDNFSFYNNNLIQVNNSNSTGNRDKTDLSSRKNIYSSLSLNHSNNDRFNLTNEVWPKTRTLLSIGSKMYRENLITSDQRGILKELILDKNQHLNMYLSLYEINNNYQVLYDNIIKLISQYSNIE